MRIDLPTRRLRSLLMLAVTLVATAGLTAEVARLGFEVENGEYASEVFSLSQEGNFPTWFSGGLHLFAALLLSLVALGTKQSGRPYARHWTFLAFAFFYISLDEVVTIHEKLNHVFDLGGALRFSWILFAGVLVLLLGLSYRTFLQHLTPPIRRGFVLAGAVFITGAMLMEIPLGLWFEAYGEDNFGYMLIDWVEETLEMVGISLFICSVLAHLGGSAGRLQILQGTLRSDDAAAPHPGTSRPLVSPPLGDRALS